MEVLEASSPGWAGRFLVCVCVSRAGLSSDCVCKGLCVSGRENGRQVYSEAGKDMSLCWKSSSIQSWAGRGCVCLEMGWFLRNVPALHLMKAACSLAQAPLFLPPSPVRGCFSCVGWTSPRGTPLPDSLWLSLCTASLHRHMWGVVPTRGVVTLSRQRDVAQGVRPLSASTGLDVCPQGHFPDYGHQIQHSCRVGRPV